MASFDLLTWNSTTLKTKRIPSSSNTLDFLSVKVGASALEIKETAGNFDFAAKKLVNIVAGTATGHAVEYDQMNTALAGKASTAYVDSVAQGLKPKQAVRAATTANINLATGLVNTTVIDTVTLATGDRVLVKNQSTASENGIYIVAVSGAASRAADFDSLSPTDEVNGAYTFIQEGSQAGQGWVQTGTVVTLGSTAINFVFFNSAGSMVGGDMITVSSSTISVDLATTSGLESSNPGNVAGQLRVKLEASNPTLQIDGSNQLGVKLNAAGGVVTGASGVAINPDNTTVELSSNALRLKALGISDGHVNASAAIALTKLAATTASRALVSDASGFVSPSAATSAEVGYLSGVTSSIQTQLGSKLPLAGGTMTGALTLSGAPSLILHAATKGYVDSFLTGMTWLLPLADNNLINDGLSTPPITPVTGATYLVGPSATGAWITLEGRALTWSGTGWVDVLGRAVIAGDRFGVTFEYGSGSEGGSLITYHNYVAELTVSTPGSYAYTFTAPANTNSVFVSAAASLEFGHSYTYNSTLTTWIEFAGPSSTGAGTALAYTGNTLNVQIDNSTVDVGSNQLRVKAGGVTGTQLNASVAGAGLAGGGGSALSVNTGDGTKIASDAVVADYAAAKTNDNAGSITVRQVVYVKANGNVDLAQANVATLGDFALGVVEAASIATTVSGNVTFRRGAVIGGYSGLTPGKKQFVNRSTAGDLTESLAGFVAGEFVYSVGRALSATQLVFDPQFEFEY